MSSRSEFAIDISLQEGGCTMISPQSKYERSDCSIAGKPTDRTEENVKKLQQTISTRMQTFYGKYLINNLNNIVPILHIDCSTKGESDIIFFILQQYTKGKENIASILIKSLNQQSIVNEQGYRKKYGTEQNPNTQEILDHYSTLLKQYIDTQEKAEQMYGSEYARIINAISNMLKYENQKYLYLYLDNTESLTINEQSRLNNILYTRGSIDKDRQIRLKINNGGKDWKTRTTNTGQRVKSSDDYNETTIKEENL